jgi:hypothetical protein
MGFTARRSFDEVLFGFSEGPKVEAYYSYNTAFGVPSLYPHLTTGSHSTCFGYQAGYTIEAPPNYTLDLESKKK